MERKQIPKELFLINVLNVSNGIQVFRNQNQSLRLEYVIWVHHGESRLVP